MSLVERCWMITSKFSVIAILIITGICFGVFVYPYMKKKREAALVSIVYIGIMSVLYLIPQQIGNFSAYMLGVVAAFLVMYVQDRRNIYQKIFLAVTFFSIRWLAVAMAGRMDDFITKALVFGNTIAGRQWLQYGLYAGTRILDIVLCIIFLAVAIGLINKAYVYKNDEMSVKELVMLIIPSLVGVTGYGILQYYLNIYEKDTGKSLTCLLYTSPSCTKRYFKFPCAENSDEHQNAEIMFASGLHDFLSFISIAQKETFHIFLSLIHI